MTKNTFMRISMIASSTLILVGVALTVYISVVFSNRRVINVDINPDEIHTVEFKDLLLVPGKEEEYILSLKSDIKEKYDAHILFNEIADGDLKKFAYVKIELNGSVIREDSLASLLESDTITLSIDPKKSPAKQIKITYYLPAEVGNEAQESTSDFELLITVSNGGDSDEQ